MHFGMQGLDPTVHHFRKTGVLTHVRDLETHLPQQTGGPSGRKETEPVLFGKGLREGNQSGFVTDG
jgi:hypothetical protein